MMRSNMSQENENLVRSSSKMLTMNDSTPFEIHQNTHFSNDRMLCNRYLNECLGQMISRLGLLHGGCVDNILGYAKTPRLTHEIVADSDATSVTVMYL